MKMRIKMVKQLIINGQLFKPSALNHKGNQLIGFMLGALISTGALANPTNPTVVNGNVSFSENGSALNITNSPGAIIDWQDFSIQNGELTRFIQQNNQSSVLNRVIGQLPSNILGELSSNGKVFLINPNGLLIGAGARIDTAGFLGSSLDISNDDFLAGKMHFKGDGGKIVNQGYIHAGKDGEVVLIAPQIENSGIIETQSGQILLAAGREVKLTSLNDANISFKIQAPGDKVINLGELIAQNGAVRVFADSITNSGSISADRVTQNADGSIRLEASSDIHISGSLSAQGHGVDGGEILVLGDEVSLQNAILNSSGVNGGTILVGGDYQGNGVVKNAQNTDVDSQSVLLADATIAGNGGKVIIWSDGNTISHGTITARGGTLSGDGGLVETSGKGTLAFGQPVDVSAPNGKPGTWLIDPEDITIGDGEAASISSALNGGSNVSIKTSDDGDGEGNITVDSAITKTQGPDASLSLEAHNDINVNAPITASEGTLDVTLQAGKSISVNANIDTNGGDFSSYITAIVTTVDEVENEQVIVPVESETPTEELVSEPSQALEEVPSIQTDPLAPISEVTQSIEEEQLLSVENEAVDSLLLNALLDDQRRQTIIRGDIATSGGEIHLKAGTAGDVIISGQVDSRSSVAQGGDITVEGQRIALIDNASVDASGKTGGGEILIGGGQQGQDESVQNAQFVYIDSDASVHADGGVSGDGGRVIVFAENVANIKGAISVRGGSERGDGGFVETSGRKNISIDSTPDISAENGKGGTWLIDPYNITITDNTGLIPQFVVNTDSTAELFEATPGGNDVWQPAIYISTKVTGSGNEKVGSKNQSFIDVDLIKTGLSMGGNVLITTSEVGVASPSGVISQTPLDIDNATAVDPQEDGNINWNADLDLDGNGGSGSLTLEAHNDININGSIYDSNIFASDDRLTNFTLMADIDNTGGGDVNFDASTGDVLIDVKDTIDVSGNNLLIKGSDTLEGAVTIRANVANFGTSANPLGGNIDIQAGTYVTPTTTVASRYKSAVEIDATTININSVGDILIAAGEGNFNQTNIHTGFGGTIFIKSDANISIKGGTADTFNRTKILAPEVTIDAGQVLTIKSENDDSGSTNDVIIGKEFTETANSITLKAGTLNIQANGNSSGVELKADDLIDIDVTGDTNLSLGDGGSNATIRLSSDQIDINTGNDLNLTINESDDGDIRFFAEDMNFEVGNDFTLQGGTSVDGSAVLLIASRGFEANVVEDMTLTGGVGNNNEVLIGVIGDGDETNTSFGGGKGAIITAKNLTLQGGSGGSRNTAQIRADFLDLDVEQDLNIQAGSNAAPDVFVSSPVSGPPITAPSQGKESIAAGILGRINSTEVNHDYTIGGDVNVIGGSAVGARAQIGGRFISFSEGTEIIDPFENFVMNVTGDINVTGGTAEQATARIVTTKSMDLSADNINVVSGAAVSADAIIGLQGDDANGDGVLSQKVTARNNLLVKSNAGSQAFIRTRIADDPPQVVYSGIQEISAAGQITVDSSLGGNASIVSEVDQAINADAGSLVGSIKLIGRSASKAVIKALRQVINATEIQITEGLIDSNSSEINTVKLDWVSGEIASQTGTLNTTGLSSINSAGEKNLKGFTWNNQENAVLDWTGGNITVDDTSVINNSGTFNISGNNNLVASTNFAAFNNLVDGSVKKASVAGETLFTNINFSNAGDLSLNSGVLNINGGDFIQTSGETDLNGGGLKSNNNTQFNGGKLIGSGLIDANVNVGAATIAPGHSAGTISINGNFNATPNSIFDFEIGGVNPGEYDVINVTGDVTLNGTFNTSFIDGYTPIIGATQDSFDVINGATITNLLASVDTGGPLGAGITASSNNTSTSFNLLYETDSPPVTSPGNPLRIGEPDTSDDPFDSQVIPDSLDVTDIFITLNDQDPGLGDSPPRKKNQMCLASDEGV